MTVKVELEFASVADAARFFSAFAGMPSTAPTNGPTAGNAASSGNPPPPPSPPAPASNAAAPATPASPSATPASPTSVQQTVETVTPKMQEFMKVFKAAGVKEAFAKHGYQPQVSALPPEGLNKMYDYFVNSLAAGAMQ